MSLIQKCLRSAPLLAKNLQVQPVRNFQAIPCRDKIPTPKMFVMGSGLIVMWLATPVYILVNLKYYNGSVSRD